MELISAIFQTTFSFVEISTANFIFYRKFVPNITAAPAKKAAKKAPAKKKKKTTKKKSSKKVTKKTAKKKKSTKKKPAKKISKKAAPKKKKAASSGPKVTGYQKLALDAVAGFVVLC